MGSPPKKLLPRKNTRSKGGSGATFTQVGITLCRADLRHVLHGSRIERCDIDRDRGHTVVGQHSEIAQHNVGPAAVSLAGCCGAEDCSLRNAVRENHWTGRIWTIVGDGKGIAEHSSGGSRTRPYCSDGNIRQRLGEIANQRRSQDVYPRGGPKCQSILPPTLWRRGTRAVIQHADADVAIEDKS